MTGLFIVVAVIVIGLGVGFYLLKRNSPEHLADIEDKIKAEGEKLADEARAEITKLTKKS